jgi:hypothetical protein
MAWTDISSSKMANKLLETKICENYKNKLSRPALVGFRIVS